jgi:hypothetical protein
LPGVVILNVSHLRKTSRSLNQNKLLLLKGRRPWCTQCKFVGSLLISVSCLALHSSRMEVTVRTNLIPPLHGEDVVTTLHILNMLQSMTILATRPIINGGGYMIDWDP